jgi:hypothetical protein
LKYTNTEEGYFEKSPATLKVTGDIIYHKNEIMTLEFLYKSTLLCYFDGHVIISRDSKKYYDKIDIIPTWNIEANLYNFGNYQAKINLTPQGKNIEGQIIMKNDFYTFHNHTLILKNTNPAKLIAYDVDVTFRKPFDQTNDHIIKGIFNADQFESDINLDFTSNACCDLSNNIRFSHKIDLSTGGKSHIDFGLKVLELYIDTDSKAIFELDLDMSKLSLAVNYLQVQFIPTGKIEPFIVYVERRIGSEVSEFTVGMENFNIETDFLQVDNTNEIRKLILKVILKTEREGDILATTFLVTLDKNDINAASLKLGAVVESNGQYVFRNGF